MNLLTAEIIPTEPDTDNAGAGKREDSILLSDKTLFGSFVFTTSVSTYKNLL